jgi:hypothetical protein
VISSSTIAAQGSEIDTFDLNVLVIAFLSVEAENIFDGTEVAGLVIDDADILMD